MAFRKYGGLNYAANNNIVRNHYANSDNQQVTNVLGQINSKVTSASHLDMSANSLLNVGCIYFYDGTTQCTAGLQGAQGAQGAQGSDGSTGATGSDGAQGHNGPTGQQGVQGQDGPTGQQGAQGAQGVTGPTGQQGATGYGAQGQNGQTGQPGATGQQGAQGVQGNSGSQGSYWTLDSSNNLYNNVGNEVDILSNLNVQDMLLYVTNTEVDISGGNLNLTNPINTTYLTLPNFTASNIGYTITTPSPGYVICPAQPNWTTAYSSPPLLGIFVVTCRQWSGGLSIGGGYVCISYFIDTFDENCFSMMTPINWNNYNPYLGNTTQDWVSSSLTRIVSLSNAPIYINYISSWPTNLSYEIVKIA